MKPAEFIACSTSLPTLQWVSKPQQKQGDSLVKASDWSTLWPDEINERETHLSNEVKLLRTDKPLNSLIFLVIMAYVTRWTHKAVYIPYCSMWGGTQAHKHICLLSFRHCGGGEPEAGQSCKLPVNICHLHCILNERGHPNQHQVPIGQVSLVLTFFSYLLW